MLTTVVLCGVNYCTNVCRFTTAYRYVEILPYGTGLMLIGGHVKGAMANKVSVGIRR